MEKLIRSGCKWDFNKTEFLIEPAPFQYISPKYEIAENAQPNQSPYIVISAPGAVGKSAFAMHLACTKNAMLWNLAKLRLGSNTFVGSVLAAVGTGQLSGFLSSLESGETTLVFDALDEAEIHSGWSGVQDFLRDVIKNTEKAAPGSVVFLARRDTAEMISIALSEILPAGRSFLEGSIRFFSKEAAVEFILSQIVRHKGREFVSRNKEILHSKAREAIAMPVVGETSSDKDNEWRSAEQERFFGYAPVLQTIAKLLSEAKNLYGLPFQKSRSGYAAIVAEILEMILEREESKFHEAAEQRFFKDDELKKSGTYTSNDQQKRLISLLIEDSYEAYSTPSNLNPSRVQEFKEMLQSFLPQHPFLDGNNFAGPAFRDYILAKGLTDEGRRFQCELWIENAQPLYTPILASIYHASSGGKADASDIELLYESANSGAIHEESGLLLFVSEENPATLTIEIKSDSTDPLGENLIFTAQKPDTLRFKRRLNNSQIFAPLALKLGNKEQAFEFSDSDISVQQLSFEANRLRVRSEGDGVTRIRSEQPIHANATLKLEVHPPASLEVEGPNSRIHPWNPYSVELKTNTDNADVETILHIVTRILGWFRKDRREDYGRYKDLIVKHAVGSSVAARYALGFIRHLGALSESGNLYFINTEILGAHEISWQKIRSGHISEKAKNALKKYLEATPQPPQF